VTAAPAVRAATVAMAVPAARAESAFAERAAVPAA
jgi:hypothetical protein